MTHNRVDVYDPDTGKIFSMKHTQLADVLEQTARNYISELATKYKPGTVISATSTNPTKLHGLQLDGTMILYVPKQSQDIPKAILEYADEMDVVIRQAAT